jgi:hypothetical protein
LPPDPYGSIDTAAHGRAYGRNADDAQAVLYGWCQARRLVALAQAAVTATKAIAAAILNCRMADAFRILADEF